MRLGKRILGAYAIAGLLAGSVCAQDNAFELELNGAKNTDKGCRVTFLAVNRLGNRLDKTAFEIGVFDEKGIFSELVVFDFGRLAAGKTKVVQYDLPRQCETISRMLLNSVKECAAEGGKDMKQDCEDKIVTRSRAEKIEFGK
jgi:hypothetical protein